MADPDFSEFDDWLAEKTRRLPGDWFDAELSPERQELVARNAALLLDKDKWRDRVERFEAGLAAIGDDEDRAETRSAFVIHFDRFDFGDAPDGHDFSSRRFPCSVSFYGARFGNSDVWFNAASFGDGDVLFGMASFGDGDVSFNGASFGDGDVSFDSANFGDGYVSLDSANFGDGDVWFDSANFGDGYVSFDSANFGNGDVSFDSANFGDGDVSFDSANFGNGDVSFDSANFGNGDVSFDSANFGDGYVWFDSANFGDGDVWFDSANFGDGDVWFEPSELISTSLSFQDSEFAGNFYVTAQFPALASFERLSVGGTARFSDCTFAEIPDFRDTKFDRPPEVARMDVTWPKIRRKRLFGRIWPLLFVKGHPKVWPAVGRWINWQGLFRIAADRDDVAKFRKLKAMAIAASDHERDNYFFAREMMAKRGAETVGFWPLLLDSAYALLSNYGQSISRPLWGFAASLFGFGAFYSGMLVDRMPLGQRLVFALEYSWRNTVPFFNTLFRFALKPEGFASGFDRHLKDASLAIGPDFDWIVAASVFQQLFGGVLLFLLLLGLRNKFRLK